jgi:hypothetical protein
MIRRRGFASSALTLASCAPPFLPLRVLLQVGYIEACTFALSLRPPLVDVGPQVFSLLAEALQLTEAKPPETGGHGTQLCWSAHSCAVGYTAVL